MISIIKTRFRNWLRRDKLICAHHRLIGSIGSMTIQTAIDLQDVIDAQLSVQKHIADSIYDEAEKKKVLDSIARFESGTDARKAMLGQMKIEHEGFFPNKPQT